MSLTTTLPAAADDRAPQPSRYAGDQRVTPTPDGGYTVHTGGTRYRVLHTDTFGWMICTGPNLDFVQVAGGGFAINIDTADHAIGALIGDPK